MSKAAFSVVLPTYNRAHIISEAIASVQAQTMPDWELIVVDDGSTDGTPDIIADVGREDPRVTLILNTGSIGPGGARNTGIRASRAERIAFIDSDDHWEVHKLELFLSAAQLHPDAVLIGSDYRFAGDASWAAPTMKSFVLGTMVPWWERYALAAAAVPVAEIRADFATISRSYVLVSMAIAGFLWIHTSSAAVRRDAALAAGLFDDRLARTEDIDLWLKLSRLGRVVYCDEVLATYDIGGRRDTGGVRYQFHHRSRRHSAYAEERYHLHSLSRIAKTSPLDDAQRRLLMDRRIALSHRCVVAAWQENRPRAFGHLLTCLASPDHRARLWADPKKYFRQT